MALVVSVAALLFVLTFCGERVCERLNWRLGAKLCRRLEANDNQLDSFGSPRGGGQIVKRTLVIWRKGAPATSSMGGYRSAGSGSDTP